MPVKKIVCLILSICLGLVFIISAYSKLWPIEPFEYTIVGTTIVGWKLSVILARVIIAVEFYLGIVLLFSYNSKRNIALASAMLLVFSIHLLYQLYTIGNNSDCGCFGNLFSMTPLQGLIKNIILILLLLLLSRFGLNYKLKLKNIEFYLLLLSLTSIFIINPVDLKYAANYLNKPFTNYVLNIDTIYKTADHEKIGKPSKDIRKGKYVVGFLSSSCSHCKIAAKKIGVMKAENASIPFYLFINGKDEVITKFRTSNNIENIPFSKLNGQIFIELAGLKLPIIYYLNNSSVERHLDYFTLEQSHIEEWLKK